MCVDVVRSGVTAAAAVRRFAVRRRRAIASGFVAAVAIVVAAVCSTEPVAASNVAAGLGEGRDLAVPTWLTLLTGATAVAASALLAALVTDRRFVDAVHEWHRPIATRAHARESTIVRAIGVGSLLGSAVGVAALAAVIVVGLEGPAMATANLGVVLAFVGVRAVLPMVAVLAVDPWPAIDPFRRLAGGVAGAVARARGSDRTVAASDGGAVGASDGGAMASNVGLLEYPPRLASWPAVVGLGALVWLELVAPVASDPDALALVAVGYAIVTVAGAVLFSPAVWFRRGDPLAVLFRLYGAVAPIQRADGRFRLVAPGSRLRDGDVVADASEVAFVLGLVWELTFNGFVVTDPGREAVETVVSLGAAPPLAYGLLLWGGFGITVGCYWLAAHLSRRTAPTYLAERTLARRFAPPLLAIAAGYHVAHYVAFAVSLAPAALAALASPFAPPVNPTTLAVPDWMGLIEIAALLGGHVLAIWAAHAVAFDCFPGRLQAIRSQAPFVAVMVGYTAVSLWLLTLPTSAPLYATG